MRFVLDENLSPKVAKALREMGLDFDDVRSLGFQSAVDRAIYAALAPAENVMVTQDKYRDRTGPDAGIGGIIRAAGWGHFRFPPKMQPLEHLAYLAKHYKTLERLAGGPRPFQVNLEKKGPRTILLSR